VEKLLNEKEVAAMLGLSVPTIRQWRYLGKGPKVTKVGERLVRYFESDVAAWLKQQSNPEGAADAGNG